MKKAIDKLKSSCQVLRKSDSSSTITISYLEAIARIRFVIADIASFLNSSSFATEQRYLRQLNDVCIDKAINTTNVAASGEAAGPAVYLLKVLVRQHGFHALNKVFEKYQWIIPKDLCEAESVKHD